MLPYSKNVKPGFPFPSKIDMSDNCSHHYHCCCRRWSLMSTHLGNPKPHPRVHTDRVRASQTLKKLQWALASLFQERKTWLPVPFLNSKGPQGIFFKFYRGPDGDWEPVRAALEAEFHREEKTAGGSAAGRTMNNSRWLRMEARPCWVGFHLHAECRVDTSLDLSVFGYIFAESRNKLLLPLRFAQQMMFNFPVLFSKSCEEKECKMLKKLFFAV